MPVVVGVDSSTSGCKVEVRSVDTGELVGHGRAPHPPTTPPRSEQDPLDWERALVRASAEAEIDRHQPAAISVAGQQHGLVVLGDDDLPLRPAKLWNDTESAPDADWLISKVEGGAAGWATACGSVPVAAFTITKLSWLHRNEPDAFARMRSVLLPHDWLTYRLSGSKVTDRGDASGTGYWSTGGYRTDLLRIVDADVDWLALLPRVLGPTEAAGTWRQALVGPGTGDNMAAALGLGLRPGDVAVSVGTSGTVFAVSPTPTADPTGAVAGFADATGAFLPLVCTLNATKVTDAVARLVADDDRARLDELALAGPPGAGGLTLVPYFDGERTPNRPAATGTLTGLRTNVSPAAVARAAFEGVVCGLMDGLDALAAAGVHIAAGRLFLIGGGARSTAYRRVLADLSGRAVIAVVDDEIVARGAAVQAAAVLTGTSPADMASQWGLGSGLVVEPDLDVDREAIRSRYQTAASSG